MKALLLILDGAGLAAPGPGNAVTPETMPTLFGAMAEHGSAALAASGRPVGLDDGQVGNSEIGHLTIGAGYVIPSTLTRVDLAYRDGAWAESPVWAPLTRRPRLHIVGLLSDAGVHGHWRSMVQAAALAHRRRGIADIVVHPILDGVDSQAGTAPALLASLRSALAEIPGTRIGLVMGRRWFCDRSGDTAVTRVFADALAAGAALPPFANDAVERHLRAATEAGFPGHLAPGGCLPEADEPVLLTQHRADRAVQVAQALAQRHPVYSLVELGTAVPVARVFFPTEPLPRGLGFELKRADLRSVRIAEACKFPHVTRFMNGLNSDLEGRPIRIDSIPDAAIAEHPEMSIEGVEREIEAAMRTPGNRVVIANIANLDQVGHLGRYELAAQAARRVDEALRRLLRVCAEEGWTALVTSDHGNADRTIDGVGRPFGSHTENPVPFTVVPPPGAAVRWRGRAGSLANVAPSLLNVLGIAVPDYMEPSLIEPVVA
jgi:2,3-bisphosphoglycerate-independent phosphoglycerate mutase